jgi:hydrogenase 3 maturation protease
MPDLDSLLVIDAGHAPENQTAELRRFAPEMILLVDAADMGQEPGSIRWIEIDEIDGMSASTHTLPLSMLAKYLSLELACDIQLLGIQPRSIDFEERISEDVLQAVNEIVTELSQSLRVLTD